MDNKYLKTCLKYQKVILIFIGLSVLSVVDTIKGFIISEVGYTMEFWLVESLSLLISVFLLYYLWNNINEGNCYTKKGDNKDKK
jgi:hypothetical protein|tara:strand:- start:151 stop:402 length:252 start_codon:yes stop_codon:yes gene_type:complete